MHVHRDGGVSIGKVLEQHLSVPHAKLLMESKGKLLASPFNGFPRFMSRRMSIFDYTSA